MEYVSMLKNLWNNLEDKKHYLVIYYIMHTISIVGILIQPYAFSMIINIIQMNKENMISDVIFWMEIYALGFVIFNFFHRVGRLVERRAAFFAKKNFIVSIYAKLHKLPIQWHSNNHSGNVIDRVNKAADSLYDFGQCQAMCIEVIIKFFGSLIMLTLISPVISCVSILTGFLMIYVTKKLYTIAVPEYREQNEGFHKISATLFDYIKNITTIITLRLGNLARKDLAKRLDEILPHIVKENHVTQVKCLVSELLVLLLNLGLILYYIVVQKNLGEAIMAGSITAIFQYLGQFVSSVQFYSFSYEDIIHWDTNYQSIKLIDEEYERIYRNKNYLCESTEINNSVSNWKDITIRLDNYSYDSEKANLKNIFVQLRRGRKIAFIGESGAGKSTFLKIIRGLLDVDNIKITIDEKVADERILENLTSLIPQEPEIFENTIRYNITMGIEADQKEVDKAAYLACFDKIVENLPNGYDTDIRENGVNLSGGEKQRLALARGFFSINNSSIILLDEPTGSLDAATEMSVYSRVFEALDDQCVVSVLHRLHLLKFFDYIYVFKKGIIVEEGSLEEFMNSDVGEFKRLWKEYLITKEEK